MSSFLVFDIETILDPELPIAESSEAQKLPAPPHHQVVAIGALLLSGPELAPRRLGIVGRESTDEAEILGEFAELVDRHNPTLVSYNGRGFDLPVIATRCLHHGIPFKGYYRGRDMRYRFTDAGHFDLMDFMADFGASKPARLDVMAKLCGMPGKVGVDGKDVGPLVFKGRIDEVRNYCLCDVVQTAGVFLRVQLLRGALERASYVRTMREFLLSIRDDERVAPVWDKMDRGRLLLGEPLELDDEAGDPAEHREAETVSAQSTVDDTARDRSATEEPAPVQPAQPD